MNHPGLVLYFANISKIPLVDDEATASREQLIGGNLKLTVHIAKSYANSAEELADRIQDANVGLCQAADAFDPSRGKFSVCAKYYITSAIRNRLVDGFGNPLRRRNSCENTRLSWDEEQNPITASNTVIDALTLDKVTKSLTEKQREVISSILEGYSKNEIARQRGITHQAVDSLERNALKTMMNY